ncbi:TrkH-domain-containing protein [Dentipellis sp. KUC8613]|nr:TrkH-domain-containing protein [Dentipellis sp. KUC8613]
MERLGKLLHRLHKELTFYRIHWLYFIITPLVLSAIFFAANGAFTISYTNALFCCVSAMTGTGLATIDLSSLTGFQQAILFVISLIGSPVAVSWVVVLVRRRYFIQHLEWIVKSEYERTKTRDLVELPRGRTSSVQSSRPHATSATMTATEKSGNVATAKSRLDSENLTRRFRPDMVRRVDAVPQRIASMDIGFGLAPYPHVETVRHSGIQEPVSSQEALDHMPRTPQTQIGFSIGRGHLSRISLAKPPHADAAHFQANRMHEDYNLGHFVHPVKLIDRALYKLFPGMHRRIRRTMTMPATSTLVSDRGHIPDGARPVSYFSFPVRVGRNSHFRGLSEDDYDELGGVEYRALNALLWIVPLYHFASLLIPFIVIAPYMSMSRWKPTFHQPLQHRDINPVWYSAFEIVGGWANTGMSLVDQNLIPFQTAYPLLLFLIYLGLAGNTAFLSWTIYKCTPRNSRLRETLHFLLDHPRRCFIYLFPSRQTWFLLIVLLSLNLTDWVFFLLLDIGNPTVEAIPVGLRILIGALQAVAVRLAGYQSLAIAALAPAVKVLYVVMMYVSAYPLAMSIRATNVYEEKSLGVFNSEEQSEEDIENEADYVGMQSRVSIMGRYLRRHIRRQLAHDLWWLAFALFLMCIVERGNLDNPAFATWFNIFSIIFEMVSAYSTVGLSLGIPTENYSFAGAMHTLSKLILMAVMLRGRHRGLPVALDRAILLPTEFLQRATQKAQQIKREHIEKRGARAVDDSGRGE